MLRRYWADVCRMSLNWVLSEAFLMIALGSGEEEHRGKVSITSHHLKSACYQHNLPLLMVTSITWLRSCLSGFSAVKSFSSPPLLALWKEVTVCNSHWRSESYRPSLRVNHLHELLGIMLHKRFVYINMSSRIFMLTLWVIIHSYFTSFVAQIIPPLATGCSCSWLLCPYHWGVWVSCVFACVCVCLCVHAHFFTVGSKRCLGSLWASPALALEPLQGTSKNAWFLLLLVPTIIFIMGCHFVLFCFLYKGKSAHCIKYSKDMKEWT